MRPEADPLQPTNYQQEAIERGRQHFRKNERGSLIAACGAGKTLVSIKVAEEFNPPAKKVLVTVPTRLLLKQTIEDWKKNFDPERGLDIVAVCSDEAVAGDVTNEEIEQEGALVTTCEEELEKALTEPAPPDRVRLVVSTYQSTPIVAEAQQGVRHDAQFDLLVVDEAHRTAGRSKEVFQTPVDNSQIRAARRLFMTATPRVARPQDREDRPEENITLESFGVDSDEVYSMDDEEEYGDIFYEITLAQAISEQEVPVSPYRVVPHVIRKSDLEFLCTGEHDLPYREMFEAEMSEDPGVTPAAQKLAEENELDIESVRGTGHEGRVTKSDVQRRLNDPEAERPNRNARREVAMERVAAAYLLQDLLERRKELEDPKVITYHHKLARARRMKSVLDRLDENREADQPGFSTSYLDGSMPMEERDQELERFMETESQDYGVLTNCKALTEGVNLEGANALMFADPKGSTIEIMQAVGRIIRRGGNEDKVGEVLLPLVVDDTEPENPKITEESRKRLRRLLFAGKQIDDKIAHRIEIPEAPVPSHPQNMHGEEEEVRAKIARMKHAELGRYSTEAIQTLIRDTLEDIKSIAGRDYYGVRWDPKRGEWVARVQNPWYDQPEQHPAPENLGTERTIPLGTYPSPEEAAEAVDGFIRDHQLPWLPNFGHNPHREEIDEPQNLTSRFPKKISFAPTRGPEGEYRAYIDAELTNARGETYEVKINNYHRTGEMDAALAHDAFCKRYGFPERRILDPSEYPTRWDLITSSHPQKVVEEGIEEDWYLHRPEKHPERFNPDQKYWAYIEDEDGTVYPLGNFPTVEAARKARQAARQQLENGTLTSGRLEEARQRWTGHLEQEGADPEPPARTPGHTDSGPKREAAGIER